MGKTWQAVVSQKAVVVDADEVLVVRDASDGDWEFPGGRIDRGERSLAALHREVREETGLDVQVKTPVFTAVKKRKKKRGKFFVYYRATTDSRAVELSAEHDDHQWLPPADAAPLLNDRRATALDRATDQ
ncbi:NUDIX hydrolase [Halorarius litoreus]|uniref:NUDIX hydrolase n=1 Tax=Halorarius litoreus TaxID=2962676 RepID=UPI0020CE014E|nr:NUDIX hydrolase [Halorarius litoreus]